MKVLLINGSPHAHGCTYAALSVAACQNRNPSASQRTLYVKTMDDKQQIEALYREMYQAMIAKDTATLNRVHADNFVLTHMTGMHYVYTRKR